jgi:hypothetical protein
MEHNAMPSYSAVIDISSYHLLNITRILILFHLHLSYYLNLSLFSMLNINKITDSPAGTRLREQEPAGKGKGKEPAIELGSKEEEEDKDKEKDDFPHVLRHRQRD